MTDRSAVTAGSAASTSNSASNSTSNSASNLGAPLLVDLVTNTLDPGYAEATERRRVEGVDRADGGSPGRWYDRPLLAVGCLLVGFVLVVAYVHANRSAPAEAKITSDLIGRVRSAQSTASNLQRNADALDTTVKQQRDAALSGAGGLGASLAAAELASGVEAVSGPGMTVTLSDPPTPTATPVGGRAGRTPLAETHILTDRDVRSVVNELWADGAEAISVNNIRLTATSAIRFAGQAVLVDFEPIIGPYQIRAIGEPGTLVTKFVQSAVASRYQTLTSAEGIGFGFDESSKLHLPGSPPTTLRYASAPSTSPSSSPVTATPNTTPNTSATASPTVSPSR